MNKNNNKMDLLGNAPVPQALMALGIPIMIGMLINALYNLVDAYFIGGLGESQMGAISIAFPLGQVVVGLGLMFGNGAASYLSRLLGRGDREAASKVASTALYSSVCIGAVIIIGTAIFLKPILTMLGATDTIMPYNGMVIDTRALHVNTAFEIQIQIFAGCLKHGFHIKDAIIMFIPAMYCGNLSVRNLNQGIPFCNPQAVIDYLRICCLIQLAKPVSIDTCAA